MKVKKLVAAMAMAFSTQAAHAACVGQQTTIFYINGVDNTLDDAKRSTQRLEDAIVPDPRYKRDCVTVKLAYNKTEGRIADFAESSRQKTLEAGLTAQNFWEMFERLIPSQNWFTEAFRTAMSTEEILYDERDSKILAQIEEHLAQYRLEPAENQLLFAAHSQGNFFANEERLAMTEAERNRTKIVSVATPSNNVAGDTEPYTTLTEDKLIANQFAAALAANITNGDNGGDCSILGGLDEYICHGWIESYMFPGSNSRTQIVNDVIAAAFPVATILGTVKDIGGGLAGGSAVSLFSSPTGVLITETVASPITAGYRFDTVPAPCPECFLKAKSPSGNVCGSVSAPVAAGDLSVKDIALDGSCDAPPPVPNQFFGAIVNGHFLQLHGFVPDSNSWAITRGNYDTPDETAWRNGVCASHLGDAQGNLEWLTRDYGANSNFSTTGFDLDTTLETKNGDGVSCQAPGTWYLAVYDASNVWAIRVLKGVVVLTQIDATHWTTVAP